MTHANEGRARFNLVIGDGFWTKLVKPFWLIAFGAIVQTVVIVYLAFYQPLPKIDEKLLTVHNALLDVGALMGSLVGQTEAALRKTLKQIDAMGRVIVMIDEVEKMVPSGSHDGGVSSRMEGTLLAWLNDRESAAFVVCTANDISKMRPEFFRAGRFDGLFFVDIPDETVRKQIWDIYIKYYGITDKKIPSVDDWTGAEIFNCCRLADLRGISLEEAALSTVPIARTACEEIDRLRTWASKRCLDAERPGRYDCRARKSCGSRRSLLNDPHDPPASAGLVVA